MTLLRGKRVILLKKKLLKLVPINILFLKKKKKLGAAIAPLVHVQLVYVDKKDNLAWMILMLVFISYSTKP